MLPRNRCVPEVSRPPAAAPKVKHRISGAWLLGPPPGVSKPVQACPRNHVFPWFRGHRRRPQKSSTGYPVPDFWARRREPRNRCRLSQGTVVFPRFRGLRRVHKSSTGYPVLDFWGRRRGPRNRYGFAQGTVVFPRFRGSRRRAQKTNAGYPVLDLCDDRESEIWHEGFA